MISLDGGWTLDPKGNKPGRYFGYTRYDHMAEALRCCAENVEGREDICSDLRRARPGSRAHVTEGYPPGPFVLEAAVNPAGNLPGHVRTAAKDEADDHRPPMSRTDPKRVLAAA